MDRITHLDELLQKQVPKFYRLLHRPAERRKISAAERRIGVELPDALRALYAWRDGSSSFPLFGAFVFLSVSEIAKSHKQLMKVFEERAAILHDAPWIPFLYDCDRQELLCIDTVGSFGGAEGQVIKAGLWEDPIEVAFESVDAWLDTLIGLLEDGVEPQRPSPEGPKTIAWDRSLAAVRRRLGLPPPRRIDAHVETLRDRVLKAGDAAKGLLLEEAVKDEGGEMRRATLDLLRERVVSPEQGAWVALDLARALLQKAGAESSKKGKGGGNIKRSAEEAYEACVEVWEDVSDALLAAARLDPSRAGEAAHVFEEAIASAATTGEQFYLQFKLGHFYHETEAIEQAIATYRAAIELHDQLPARLKRRAFDGAHNNLGLLLDLCGRYAEAEAIYLSGIALSPRDGSMRKGLADTRMRLGRPLEALPEYRLAVKRLPSWLGAWTALVTCCRKLDLDAEAERALMKARKTASGSEASLVEKACLLAVEGDTEAAIEALRDSIEADPSLRRVMRNDLDFESLWGDPRFLALVS